MDCADEKLAIPVAGTPLLEREVRAFIVGMQHDGDAGASPGAGVKAIGNGPWLRATSDMQAPAHERHTASFGRVASLESLREHLQWAIELEHWRDDPMTLMQVLQSYLRIEDGEQAPGAVFRRGAEAAEGALASLIADSRRTRFGWRKAFVMKRAARRMRAVAGLRESPKVTAISMLGVVRAGVLASAAS